MGFYYDDDDEFNNSQRSFSGPVAVTIGLVSAAILIILILVMAVNNTTTGKNNLKNTQMMNKESTEEGQSALDVANGASYDKSGKSIEELYEDHQLTAQDLDFWDMYNEEKVIVHSDESGNNADLSNDDNPKKAPENDESVISEASDSPTPSTSASPTPSPTPSLISGVKENTLDYTNVRIVDEQLHYTLNGNEISKIGVEVSSDCGVVNFTTLKDAGIDFVMLKVGHRGYDSGVIEKDSNFDQNLKAASEAGLEIGLFFSSRAVTTTEAQEEADYCISQSQGYSITYPIAFMYEGTLFDSARTDELDQDDLTQNALAFISQVKSKGYNGILFGNEQYLLEDIDAAKTLPKVDVWLNDQTGMPKYPYNFVMWRYMTNVGIQGMEKNGSYTVSFIDYAMR